LGKNERLPLIRTADECLLPAARFAEGVAHHRVVGEAPDAQSHGGVAIQQTDGPGQVARVRHLDIVVEEHHSFPAECMAKQQGQVALGADVRPPLEYRSSEQAGGRQFGKPEIGCLRHVDRDQVDRGIKLGGGCGGARPSPAVQGDQWAAQGQRGGGRFLQVGHLARGGHDDRVDLHPRR
jgi:hypothetical protein